MKIAALTPGKNIPSSRFRINQYIDAFEGHGIGVKEYHALLYDNKIPGPLGKIKQRYIFPISGAYELLKLVARLPQALMTHTCDATWLNRTFYNAINLELLLKKPLVFDIDDAIWINSEKHVSSIVKSASHVIAGNSYIAEWVGRYNKNISIIATAIDTDVYTAVKSKDAAAFNIGWSGTSDNLQFVYQIEDALGQFLTAHRDARLIILSNSAPAFKTIAAAKVEWVKWSPENEVATIQRFDVGLMPLEDTEWAKGKCSFKMLQYMSTGIPVVVSPVGMNVEVLAKGEAGYSARNKTEWLDALTTLYRDRSLLERMGREARKVIEAYYSQKQIAGQLIEVFKKTV